jgi:DNA-binding beta-propeller fold protein YncE
VIRWFLFALGLLLAAGVQHAGGQADPNGYLFYVASESEDEVTLLRFMPDSGLAKVKVIPVGGLPAEIEAPHGIFMDPDGVHWYLTLGHGFPFGTLLKYATEMDTVVGNVALGMFPATVAVPPFGGLAFAVNSDFHGDMVPSTVSIVEVDEMIELARTETCTMPHGSRFSPDGMKHYSACMMDDQLVEIDLRSFAVARRLDLVTGQPPAHHASGVAHQMREHTCSPTWVAPSPDGAALYVTCNRGDEVVEVDAMDLAITRRFPAPNGPYNAAVTPNGQLLVVTQKGSGAVSIFDLGSGERLALIPTIRKVTHGVVVSPDNRYAFITVEGIGGEPGTVEVIDLQTRQRVASAEVGKQAGGIAFWKRG